MSKAHVWEPGQKAAFNISIQNPFNVTAKIEKDLRQEVVRKCESVPEGVR